MNLVDWFVLAFLILLLRHRVAVAVLGCVAMLLVLGATYVVWRPGGALAEPWNFLVGVPLVCLFCSIPFVLDNNTAELPMAGTSPRVLAAQACLTLWLSTLILRVS